MNKLIQLTDNIQRFNLMGRNQLPNIKLTIIIIKLHRDQIDACLAQLNCQEAPVSNQDSAIRGYKLYRSSTLPGMQLHLVNSLEDQQNVADQEFVMRKKLIQRLKSTKDMLFLYFARQAQIKNQRNDRSELMELRRVDSTVSKDILWKGSALSFQQELAKRWQAISRFQLMTCLQHLKLIIKDECRDLTREQEWLSMANGRADTLSYAFKLINLSKEYLVCSLEGYYSREAHRFQNVQSVHWQIMDILQDLWREQGDRINHEIERMPLSYIGESLRMSEYHSIGGFLPEDCFLRIFKPLLSEFCESVLACLGAIKYKVIKTLQTVYDYYLERTTVRQAFMQMITREIEQICDAFLSQMQNSLQSQISYVYAPAETFWEMRNIKSNLYSPQQQANIEVKYIGKVYVRRVYESIRQSIPRYLGQSLLRKVSKYISAHSLNCLLEVMKEVAFQVRLSEQEISSIMEKEKRRRECERLINYFSLKVSSTYLIKNLLQKQDFRWKQMYNTVQENQMMKGEEIAKPQRQSKKGVIAWMKNLFRSPQTKSKRAQSNEKLKREPNQAKLQQKVDSKPVQPIVSEKVWILALNTNKKIEDHRLLAACAEGFPARLRPAIWYWMAKRGMDNQKQLKLIDVMTKGAVNADVIIQIEKDLGRTPPSQLFRKKMRDSLRRVLEAYSLTDTEIQYTQGMNFIVAIILCTLVHWGVRDDYLAESSEKPNLAQIQQRAFTIFRFLMLKQGLRKMMFIEREHIAELCYRVDLQIRELNSKVSSMIERSGFSCELIFSPILISGLATWSKDIAVGRRILDLVMGRGFGVLYKVVAGVAAMSEQKLSKLKNQMVYEFLRTKAMDEFYQQTGERGLSELFTQI